MQKIFEDGYSWIKSHWHQPGTLLALYVFWLIVMVFSVTFDSAKINKIFWGIYILLILISTVYWFYCRRLEKCPSGKVGIVLAFKTENIQQFNKLQYDFVEQIQNRLDPETFSIIKLPYNRCIQLKEDNDIMLDFLEKTRSHMLLYGVFREGKKKGKETYEIDLSSMIRHGHLESETHDEFKNELNYFTRTMLIDKEDSLSQYKLTSNWLTTYARYFVGLAALLSQDFDTALRVLEKTKESLNKERNSIKPVAEIKKRIDTLLTGVYHYLTVREYRLFWESKDYKKLDDSRFFVEKYQSLCNDRYTPAIYNSIFAFLQHRNISKAKSILNEVSQTKDASHVFSMGFLHAYEGDIRKAIRFYKKAKKMPFNNELVLIQVEEFIEYILEIEPERNHLYLCLAWINYYKGDYKLGLKDLQKYLKLANVADQEKYSELISEISLEFQTSEVTNTG